MSTTERICLLTAQRMEQKIERMAFQIIESHFSCTFLTVLGVGARGFSLAEKLTSHFGSLARFKFQLSELDVIKDTRHRPVSVAFASSLQAQGVVLLVDDVLNTGQTLALCLRQVLTLNPQQVDTAVLIERSHKLFPIEAHFVGHKLSTTLSDYVEVSFDPPMGVYLK